MDRLLERNQGRESLDAKDYGVEAAWSAFVYRVTQQPQYLELAQKCLDASLRYYDACFAERKSVNWYSTSRVHVTLAWDWLFEDLPEATRRETMERLVRAIDRVLEADPPIYRENLSGYNTGFYGVRNCLWFIGCTAYGTGIAPEKVNEWLVWGRNENLKLLEHRQQACGDDGGGASATLGYLLGAYPWSEQNFFYTWLSATGENIAPDWPHSAWLANYAIWNWIESEHGPREFGYGDTDHTEKRAAGAAVVHAPGQHPAPVRKTTTRGSGPGPIPATTASASSATAAAGSSTRSCGPRWRNQPSRSRRNDFPRRATSRTWARSSCEAEWGRTIHIVSSPAEGRCGNIATMTR